MKIHLQPLVLALVLCPCALYAQVPRAIPPTEFIHVYESSAPQQTLGDIVLGQSIDRRSNIRIVVDNTAAVNACRATGAESGCEAHLLIQARIQRKDASQIIPIPVDNYTSVTQTTGPEPEYKLVSHNKRLEVKGAGGRYELIQGAPSAFINLNELGAKPGDRIYLKITNIRDQSDLDYVADIAEFGWNLRVTDTLLLLRRLGVDPAEEGAGVKPVNFRPAPGVSFGWVYTSRKKGLLRALAPGVGYAVSFTDWNDPAFDPAAGQFVKGTDANKIEVASGPIFTLFDNTLQFSYGWNLNVRQDRTYVAVGFSFFKFSEKLTSYIKQ